MTQRSQNENVWAVIHHAYRIGGDVSVASNRADDLEEWERAHHAALRNMQNCRREAARWDRIADEISAHSALLASRRAEK